MAREKSHKQVEFVVEAPPARNKIYKTFEEAAAAAVYDAIGREGPVYIEVLVWGEAGAKWWGGDEGVEAYRGDPEASVFQRFEIRGRDMGMIA